MPLDLPPLVDTVVVEAARLPPSPGDKAFSIVTIGSETIATAPRLDEALTATPGVQLFRRTSSQVSNPTTQGISVRSIAGSGASRALVLLDGVPQNDPFGGWVLWTGLPTISVEQARVVRGAGAGPYGAGALTGTIQLSERTRAPRGGEYEVYGGERGLAGAAAAGAIGDLFLSAATERSDGWVPLGQGRGAADTELYYQGLGGALRWTPQVAGKELALRLSGYQEKRGAGLVGADSRATGATLSATLVDQPDAERAGWRLQGWLKRSDFENRSAAVAAGRNTTTPASEQYATPAMGYGLNAALRRDSAAGGWEVGADARIFDGETREKFRYIAGAFTRDRVAGGTQSVLGAYGEAYRNAGDWLLTGGVRLDRWATYDGQRRERDAASGAVTLDNRPADRDGWLPTGRLGARYGVSDSLYLRGAAYAGFRPATLNELYRPFRVGNDVTEANAGLEPEKLYGVEFGVGAEGDLRWDVTVFANRLDGAVANVTIGFGPATFPIAGLIPAGGVLRQRQNAGQVDAYGIEAEVERRWESVSLRLAGAYTDAEVDGGSAAPQLTGLRPAQTPRFTATGEATWRPIEALNLRAVVRYEGDRFDDDLNTRELSAATDVNLRADWTVSRSVTLYAAAENLFDAKIETAQTGDGLESYDQPQTFRVGLVLRR
ncbi:TonB-dependent receptor [Phenylobacterium sp. Root77]|uniref:TonB-dependent receptor n=1 Tax=unclassified Phenylobacterium TaxID=2640670 RepID=UPI0006FF9958|nr:MULTISPECIES: TonB-dependent receptor [unclassified Phenylobacterium]KQW72118.1 TonB-dependent receptor [Phenylobacterium sp. Root1277]KQW95038.1 TonB-dependent receptor [Phenylobacterium sp. Root1290]KRC44731.1 TonB-dependent receptor [Phenylobacterium sp. Root77]